MLIYLCLGQSFRGVFVVSFLPPTVASHLILLQCGTATRVLEGQSYLLRIPCLNSPLPAEDSASTSQPYRQMDVFRYSGALEDLEVAERNAALLTMVSGIPSVLQMRKHLLGNPGCRLSQAKEILDQSTYRLLFWTVASNRSFIVQDEPVKVASAAHLDKSPKHPGKGTDHQTRVLGTEDSWMQFRFVQGSPEKERRFTEAVKLVAEEKDRKPFPTLFAWHGGPLGNWHGIVSTGLNFDRIDHGRSYGAGIYLSSDSATSRSYSMVANLSTPVPFSQFPFDQLYWLG